MILHPPPPPYSKSYFSRNLAHLRRLHGTSFARLSAKLGVPVSELAIWENSYEMPPRDYAKRVAELYEIHLHDLLHTDLTGTHRR